MTIGGGWYDYTEDVDDGDSISIVCSLDVKYVNDASLYMTINGMRANDPPDQKFNGKVFYLYINITALKTDNMKCSKCISIFTVEVTSDEPVFVGWLINVYMANKIDDL